MTPRSLFNIILKIFGLFFLRDIVLMFPQLITTLFYFTKSDSITEGIFMFLGTAITISFYCFLVFHLLFKTDNLLDKLKLDKGFDQQEFSFNISIHLVLTIALIVTGGLLLTNEIPNLCRQLFSYFQERRLTHGMTKPDFSFSIIAAVKVILGLLIIGERKRILEFLETRQKKNVED